ncbi:hypothetical protein HMPREF1357_00032 [Enterococcus faecium C497]|nr:hypothetical protein HMPREF1357_00032 [Enterococcus faecium C497]EJY25538.1 hypothetical protein HMPREF1356_00125 [Enterococcus faecium C1904]
MVVHKQTIGCSKDSVPLGRVRTQPTVKRFKRGLKRDYKRGGQNFPPKKAHFFR